MELKIVKGKDVRDELFKKFYLLIKKSFPGNEHRGFERQKALLEKNIYEILFCFDNNEVIGILAYWHLDSFVFIEHFAVDEFARGNGVGTKMLEFIKKTYQITIILEVELPCNEISKRRILFYKRNGFCYNDFEYYQKPLNPGDEPLPLRIMSYPGEITSKEFQKIIKTLVNSVYKS